VQRKLFDHAAQQVQLGVEMRVDQAGEEDAAAAVDGLGVGRRASGVGGVRREQRLDAAIADHYIVPPRCGPGAIERDDEGALEQEPAHLVRRVRPAGREAARWWASRRRGATAQATAVPRAPRFDSRR
jgi:hypothetical protein